MSSELASAFSKYYETTHLIVDIETLSLPSDKGTPFIIDVGAIVYSPRDQSCEIILDCQVSQPANIVINANVLRWWFNQDPRAIKRIFSEEREICTISAVHDRLGGYIQYHDDQYIWSNPPGFDIELLNRAFIDCGCNSIHDHHKVRDLRTMISGGLCKSKDRRSFLEARLKKNPNNSICRAAVETPFEHAGIYDALIEGALLDAVLFP